MTLEHRAFLYRDAEDFLDVTVPFLRRGLELDEAVVAVVREPGLSALRDEFAGDADIDFIDSAGFYLHPVRTLKGYQELVVSKAPRPVRAVAEPVWTGFSDRETLEWVRYESLINEVFKDSGASALCPYDSSSLPPEILDQARRTHPVLVHGGDLPQGAPNPDYVNPAAFGDGCDRQIRFDRPGTAEYLAITSGDLREMRGFVGERATSHGLPRTSAQNLVTAANEVAANALQHGCPPIGVWIWPSDGGVICEIGDSGVWHPSSLTGFLPPDSALQRGFGLWTVRLLVDLMELRAGWDGTFVRMHINHAD